VRLGVTNRLAFVLVVIGALLASACDIAPFDVFTDPSTRLAGALRDAALVMDLQRQDTYTLAYHFKPGHDGCKSGDFRLEMAANAGLLVVCTAPMGPGDMGGLTTSHCQGKVEMSAFLQSRNVRLIRAQRENLMSQSGFLGAIGVVFQG
jgi:hypothetical protein